MERKPGVVTLVQVVLWISVVASAIMVCLFAGVSSSLNQVPADARALLMIGLVLLVAGAVLNAVIAVQLGNHKNWARITGMVLAAISLAWSGITMMAGSAQTDAGTCIGIVLNLIIVGCLASSDAKEWCTE